eukprot:3650919-Amphidinium_carterae.1
MELLAVGSMLQGTVHSWVAGVSTCKLDSGSSITVAVRMHAAKTLTHLVKMSCNTEACSKTYLS